MQELVEADYFLFLRSQLQDDDPSFSDLWYPWCALYLTDTPPRYILEAVRSKVVSELARALRVESIDVLRSRLRERALKYKELVTGCRAKPFVRFDLDLLGSK